jgi:hypothetical protein
MIWTFASLFAFDSFPFSGWFGHQLVPATTYFFSFMPATTLPKHLYRHHDTFFLSNHFSLPLCFLNAGFVHGCINGILLLPQYTRDKESDGVINEIYLQCK